MANAAVRSQRRRGAALLLMQLIMCISCGFQPKQAAKLAEKEAKKAKAQAKKEKMAAMAAGDSKNAERKAKAKAESEAKRVGVSHSFPKMGDSSHHVHDRTERSRMRHVSLGAPCSASATTPFLHPWNVSTAFGPIASSPQQAEEAAEVKAALEAVQATPKGQKKDTAAAMLKGYDPPTVEAAWYRCQHATHFCACLGVPGCGRSVRRRAAGGGLWRGSP